MPPKKRARKNQPAPSVAATTEHEDPAPKPPLPPGANTGLVFDLPPEIWLEILSSFTSVRIPALKISGAPLLPSSSLERREVLRALSQTCRQLRTLFLPELWNRFEVCATRRSGDSSSSTGINENDESDIHGVGCAWYKIMAETLETRSNGLRSSPQHANFVHMVSVVLTRCQHITVLSAFVRCLLALPNLTTLQILRAHTQMTTHLKIAFEGHAIRQVRTVAVPDHAHNVLRSCPEVRRVICNYGDGGKLVSAIQKECKKVERLEGFRPDEKMMKRLVKAVPSLQEMRFGMQVDLKVLGMLATLKHLRAIELIVPATPTPEVAKCVELAKHILRKAKPQEEPCLRLRHAPSQGPGWVEEVDVAAT